MSDTAKVELLKQMISGLLECHKPTAEALIELLDNVNTVLYFSETDV